MRVLMITNPTTRGHINPLVGVVEQLRAAGAEVGWLALTHKQARDLERLPVTVLPTERELPLPRGGERGRWFDDDATKLATFKGICIDSVEPMLGCTLRAIDRFDPMVLAVDTVSWLGGAAAHCSGRPYLGICMGLKLLHADGLDFPYRRLVRALDGPRDALFQRLGWHPEVRLMECMSPHGNVTFATKALVGDDLTGEGPVQRDRPGPQDVEEPDEGVEEGAGAEDDGVLEAVRVHAFAVQFVFAGGRSRTSEGAASFLMSGVRVLPEPDPERGCGGLDVLDPG